MRKLWFISILIAALVACAKNGQPGAPGMAGAVGETGAAGTAGVDGAPGPVGMAGPSQPPPGASSGGGGFVIRNSRDLLVRTSRELGQMLRLASPEIFAKLPKGWTQNRLAEIVENIRLEPDRNKRREGLDLNFDYGSDAKGEYISALEPFFAYYSWVGIDYLDDDTLWTLQQDMYRQLLHEVVHHLKVGVGGNEDDRAYQLAKDILAALINDMMLCKPGSDGHEVFKKMNISGWFIFRTLPIGYQTLAELIVTPDPWQTLLPYGQSMPREYVTHWNGQIESNQLVLTEITEPQDTDPEEMRTHTKKSTGYFGKSLTGGTQTLRLVASGNRATGSFEVEGLYYDLNPEFKKRATAVGITLTKPEDLTSEQLEKIRGGKSEAQLPIHILTPGAKDKVSVTCERHFKAIEFP